MKKLVEEYGWELVWEIDIMRWPDDYKVYLLRQRDERLTWVVKLQVQNLEFIVTQASLAAEQGSEITRRTFLDFLQQCDDPSYQLWFERNHQHMVGQLLDVLSYTLALSHKINSAGKLNQTVLNKHEKVLSHYLAEQRKNDKK